MMVGPMGGQLDRVDGAVHCCLCNNVLYLYT